MSVSQMIEHLLEQHGAVQPVCQSVKVDTLVCVGGAPRRQPLQHDAMRRRDSCCSSPHSALYLFLALIACTFLVPVSDLSEFCRRVSPFPVVLTLSGAR